MPGGHDRALCPGERERDTANDFNPQMQPLLSNMDKPGELLLAKLSSHTPSKAPTNIGGAYKAEGV